MCGGKQMTEIELKKNRNGMAMLILLVFLYLIAVLGIIVGGALDSGLIFIVSIIYVSLGWIFF